MVDPLSLMLVVIELRGVRAGWRFNLSGDLQLWRRHKPQVCRVPQLLPPLRRIDFHSDAGLRLPLRACDDCRKSTCYGYLCGCGAEHSEHTRTTQLALHEAGAGVRECMYCDVCDAPSYDRDRGHKRERE